MAESKVRVVKVHKTEYRRTYDESEVEDILRRHAMLEAGEAFEPHRDESRFYVRTGDNLSGGPYRRYEVTVTREDGEAES